MPVIFDSAPVFPIERTETLVKYLDLAKFLSLLKRKSFFFCRLNKLEDQFEGTTAKKNYESRINWYRWCNTQVESGTFSRVLTEDEILQKVNEYYDFENRIKALTCVNCWNNNQIESAALWKIYSDNGQGIRLKTTVQKLIDSLTGATPEIRISRINYIDYSNDTMDDGNTMFPIIHKHHAYHYEEEVRLIHEVKAEKGFVHDWKKEESEFGIYVPVDMTNLIDEIVVGPFSKPYIFEIIQDLCVKYDIKSEIRKSELTVEK